MSARTEVDDGRRGRRALAAAPPRARRAPRGLRGVPPRARGDGADARHARGAADGGGGVREPGGGHPAPRPAGRSRRGGGCARERLEELAAAPGLRPGDGGGAGARHRHRPAHGRGPGPGRGRLDAQASPPAPARPPSRVAKVPPPAEPPAKLADAPDLFMDFPILRNMDKLRHFEAIRTTTLAARLATESSAARAAPARPRPANAMTSHPEREERMEAGTMPIGPPEVNSFRGWRAPGHLVQH